MPDTELEAWLTERKAVHSKATEGPWEADGTEISQHWSRPEPWAVVASNEIACMAFCYGGSARGIEHEEDANAAVDAFNTLPALVAMVEAVLGVLNENTPPDPCQPDDPAGMCPDCSLIREIRRALEAARKAVSGDAE